MGRRRNDRPRHLVWLRPFNPTPTSGAFWLRTAVCSWRFTAVGRGDGRLPPGPLRHHRRTDLSVLRRRDHVCAIGGCAACAPFRWPDYQKGAQGLWITARAPPELVMAGTNDARMTEIESPDLRRLVDDQWGNGHPGPDRAARLWPRTCQTPSRHRAVASRPARRLRRDGRPADSRDDAGGGVAVRRRPRDAQPSDGCRGMGNVPASRRRRRCM